MRLFGRILGGLYLLDGLVALFGGKKAADWFYTSIGRFLPGGIRKQLVHVTDMKRGTVTMMGISNIIAGSGMLLAASGGRGMRKMM